MNALTSRFKDKPNTYYALSICATWAGIGSLMNGVELTRTLGAIPSAIWVIGNILACIVFGLVATKVPKVREVFCSVPMKIICAVMCIFQAWLSMNGMMSVFSDTPITATGGRIIAYVLSIGFLLILLKFGMIRNVLTDGAGWIIVYLLAVGVTIAALITTPSGEYVNVVAVADSSAMGTGIWKAILLLPGPFTYPYFFEILNYNDKNTDGTHKVLNITKTFAIGGIMFGVYMLIVFPLAWAQFTPVLSIVKAVLITIIGTSTLSSSMYSIYIAFGRIGGFIANAAMIGFWAILIPLGVMNLWTLMASIRIYFVGAGILVAIIWWLIEKTRNKNAGCKDNS